MGKTDNERTMTADGWDAAWGRIMDALGIRTQVELGVALGIRQSSISDAKRRGSIPADWQLTLFEKYGLVPLWVRTGEGPRRIGEPMSMTHARVNLKQVEQLFNDFTKNASAALGLGATG